MTDDPIKTELIEDLIAVRRKVRKLLDENDPRTQKLLAALRAAIEAADSLNV